MPLLNRIGLFLTFLGAFLVAPELIGKDRLEKLRQAINDEIQEIDEAWRGARKTIMEMGRSGTGIKLSKLVKFGAWFVGGLIARVLLTPLTFVIGNILVVISRVLQQQDALKTVVIFFGACCLILGFVLQFVATF
jgi:hypothetical protein